MADIYKDSIMKKYVELITDKMPGMFKGVYFGDPMQIPFSNMPALIIYKNSSQIKAISNGEDEHLISLTFNVVYMTSQQISDDKTMAAGVSALYELVEGRDDNYKLNANCLLNILRSNQIVDAAHNLRTDLATATQTDYTFTFNKRGKDVYTQEATVKFVVDFIQLRN